MNSVTEIVWKDIQQNEELEAIIEKVIQKCFEVEHINPTSLYICVTLTDPKNIREINKEYRNIDKETDVLSFPMFEKDELDKLVDETADTQVETLQDIMGDIIISIERVEEQAKEYGHSFERELSYMVVHGFYHLMGYDHMVEDDKKQMRKKEENILEKLNISRDLPYEADKDHKMKNEGFLDAWKNAINGIIYATTTQGNIKRQLIIAVLVVIISLFFDLSKAEFLIFMFTIVLIIFAEMVNTAIETVVDLYTDLYHPKAKIAKDVAAGGVVITAINAVIVAYFLFFDKISNIGLEFIRNIASSPVHLAFASVIITIIGILALIAIATTNKHKILNKRFIPSGHAALGFAANTIIWLTTDNVVIITLSLVLSILLAESRIESNKHKLSEVVFSSCVGIMLVLIIYGLISLAVH